MLKVRSILAAGKLSAIICLGISVIACTGELEKPDTDSDSYKKAVSDFYVSLAAVQSDQTLFALEKMQEVTEAYPVEASAWANMGVFSMRQGAFDVATERLEKAIDLAPENADILFLRGLLESRKGNIEEAINYLELAVEKDGDNPKILYTLADELERQDSEENSARIIELLNKILEEDPDNLAVLLETVRIASKWGDRELLKEALSNLHEQSEDWPEQIQQQFIEQREAILEKQGGNIMFELAFLRNNLNELPVFQQDLATVQLPANEVGFLISEFLWLPRPEKSAPPADTALSFNPIEANLPEWTRLIKPVALGEEESTGILLVTGNDAIVNGKYRLSFPGEYDKPGSRLPGHAVSTIDYNYDFLNDIAMAGPGGLAIYRQDSDSSFSNVTVDLQISDSVRRQPYKGVWSYDVDSDGDLDLLLAPSGKNLIVLRNNGDDTFSTQNYFEGLEAVRDMIWADFDIDGDPDAVFLLENGSVRYFENKRGGQFVRNEEFNFSNPVTDISFGDLNGNGFFEIVALKKGEIEANGWNQETQSWSSRKLISFENPDFVAERGRIFINDLDNNSALDILASNGEETRYWLSNESLSFSTHSQKVNIDLFGLADIDGDTRLDLLGLAPPDSESVILKNSGSLNYKARILRPRASGGLGDKRINSFGIGGEIEARSGVQYTKQPISQPWVHMGLGNHEGAEMVRIIWPNGSVQAEFAELGYDSKIMNEQILKGSCPWVFTHNGEEMEFVTDFLWRTALGLRINAQGDASVIHSIDWIKINGDQLKPKDGYYDVRITADLWETHFFDHVSLIAVDRPQDIEVFVDERFTLPAPDQKLYPVREVHPVTSAKDQDGNDVSEIIKEADGNYLDTFDLTEFQGLAEEHFVEVNIGETPAENNKLWLIASGWVYPTDSSINIAISQGKPNPPQGIRVEVPDGEGGWKTAKENVGFPAGKNKTMLIDLEDIFPEKTDRRIRLYTNMEIYWDQLQVGVKEDVQGIKTRKIAAETAELRFRGYSKVERPGRFTPEIPVYDQISGTTPKWFDLVGFYTRFGDVKELTEEIDDRYVIMNAGDELVFKFPAASPPPAGGWKRDYVLVGDGWVKDGDLNTGFSKTVIPLPYHGMEDYSEEPGRLQDDPVYQRFTKDWVNYHTRYITPKNFSTALRFRE